jgi:hypothetical protein
MLETLNGGRVHGAAPGRDLDLIESDFESEHLSRNPMIHNRY